MRPLFRSTPIGEKSGADPIGKGKIKKKKMKNKIWQKQDIEGDATAFSQEEIEMIRIRNKLKKFSEAIDLVQNHDIGTEFREGRIKAGLTQQQLADESRTTKSLISKIEANVSNPSSQLLEIIIRALEEK